VEPSAKLTVPVGVAEPEPVTVAVKVTDWPATEELGDEDRVVAEAVLAGALTGLGHHGRVLEALALSPW